MEPKKKFPKQISTIVLHHDGKKRFVSAMIIGDEAKPEKMFVEVSTEWPHEHASIKRMLLAKGALTLSEKTRQGDDSLITGWSSHDRATYLLPENYFPQGEPLNRLYAAQEQIALILAAKLAKEGAAHRTHADDDMVATFLDLEGRILDAPNGQKNERITVKENYLNEEITRNVRNELDQGNVKRVIKKPGENPWDKPAEFPRPFNELDKQKIVQISRRIARTADQWEGTLTAALGRY